MDLIRVVSLISVLSLASVVPYSEIETGISSAYDSVAVDSWYESGEDWDLEKDKEKGPGFMYSSDSDLYIVGETDKNPMTYEVGETMTFTLAAYVEGKVMDIQYFQYRLYADDGTHSSGLLEASDGTATITASCSVPGFVHLKVSPCDADMNAIRGDNIIPFEGGACAGFGRITKTMPEPEDFDAFWKEQLSLLDGVPCNASRFTEYTNHKYTDYTVYDVSIPCIEGSTPVSGYVCVPKNASPGSLKIRVIYMGYSVAPAVIRPVPGYITFCINPHGIDNGMYDLYYKLLEANELSNFGFYNNEVPTDSYFRNMILRDIHGVRYIKDAFKYYWNGKDLELQGASMGAFQSAAVASLIPDDITKVTLEIPWMCDLGSENHGRLGGWRPKYCQGLGYYDTVSFGKRIKAPTEIIAGLGDYTCPPSGVSVLYSNLMCQKKITFTQNMTHERTPVLKLSYSH